MMTTRVLPPDEWSRLAGTELEPALELMNPKHVTVFVVEDEDGAIIGCWSFAPYYHVEGLWIHSDHRKRGRVLAKLWSQLRYLADVVGCKSVLTGAVTLEVAELLEHRGAMLLPSVTYALPLVSGRSTRKKEPCQSSH